MQVSPYDDGRITMPYSRHICFFSKVSVPNTKEIIAELVRLGYKPQPYYFRIEKVNYCPRHKRFTVCMNIYYRLPM